MLNLKCFFLIMESTLVMQCNLETSSKNVNLLESKISPLRSRVERLVVVDEKFLLLCPGLAEIKIILGRISEMEEVKLVPHNTVITSHYYYSPEKGVYGRNWN